MTIPPTLHITFKPSPCGGTLIEKTSPEPFVGSVEYVRADSINVPSPEWFYPEDYDETCRFSVDEVIDYYDLGIGRHVVPVECAKPLPRIWCAVHVLSEDEQEAMKTDGAYVFTEHTTEAEALASLPPAPNGGE